MGIRIVVAFFVNFHNLPQVPSFQIECKLAPKLNLVALKISSVSLSLIFCTHKIYFMVHIKNVKTWNRIAQDILEMGQMG